MLFGKPATWFAIVSTDTTDARDNIGDPSAPICRLYDTRIADDEADLFDGSLAAPLNVDEAGNTYQNFVLTGSSTMGTAQDPLGEAHGAGFSHQCRTAHQIAVTFAGGASAFLDGPDDQ